MWGFGKMTIIATATGSNSIGAPLAYTGCPATTAKSLGLPLLSVGSCRRLASRNTCFHRPPPTALILIIFLPTPAILTRSGYPIPFRNTNLKPGDLICAKRGKDKSAEVIETASGLTQRKTALRYRCGNQRPNLASHRRQCPQFRLENHCDVIPGRLPSTYQP